MSLGYVPPVPRLKLPARRGNPWVFAPWNDSAAVDGHGSQKGGRRGLILDLDETLYPREQFALSGFAAVAQHVAFAHGFSADAAFAVMSRAYASPQRGREFQRLCQSTGLSTEVLPSLVDVFRRHIPVISLHDDVADALHQLRAAGWRLGILTNGLPSVQFRKIAALELTALVDEIVYAEEHVTGGKPASAAFNAALRSLDLAAEQCICLGDDLVRDVGGARALGMRTIRIAREGVTPATGVEADMVIDSLRQLPNAARLLSDPVTADVA